jgi:hypothetical protein
MTETLNKSTFEKVNNLIKSKLPTPDVEPGQMKAKVEIAPNYRGDYSTSVKRVAELVKKPLGARAGKYRNKVVADWRKKVAAKRKEKRDQEKKIAALKKAGKKVTQAQQEKLRKLQIELAQRRFQLKKTEGELAALEQGYFDAKRLAAQPVDVPLSVPARIADTVRIDIELIVDRALVQGTEEEKKALGAKAGEIDKDYVIKLEKTAAGAKGEAGKGGAAGPEEAEKTDKIVASFTVGQS